MPAYIRKTSQCQKCPLRSQRRIWSYGEFGSGVAFFGEAGGIEEDNWGRTENYSSGRPFVGASGRLLRQAIAACGIKPESCWYGNLASDRFPNNDINSPEAQSAMACCRPGLFEEIEWLKQQGIRCIVALGAQPSLAFGLLDPQIRGGITAKRGSVVEKFGLPFLCTYHPSAMLRGGKRMGRTEDITWQQDINKAFLIARDGYHPPTENFNLFPTRSQWEAFVKEHTAKRSVLGFDIENTRREIVCAGFAPNESDCIVVPFLRQGGHQYWSADDRRSVEADMRFLLSMCPVIIQSATHELRYCPRFGFPIKHLHGDVLLAHYILHPELPHDLGYITSTFGSTPPDWKHEVQNSPDHILQQTDISLRRYNARDTVVLHQAHPALLRQLQMAGLTRKYEERLQLVRPAVRIMNAGMLLDESAQTTLHKELDKKVDLDSSQLRADFDLPSAFNFNSPQHMAALLYGERVGVDDLKKKLMEYDEPGSRKKKNTKGYRTLQGRFEAMTVDQMIIPPAFTPRLTDTGFTSVAEEALLSLRIACENRLDSVKSADPRLQDTALFLGRVAELIKVNHLLTSFTNFKPDPDGRIRCDLSLHKARTLRLASKEPNLQNVPKSCRHLFVTRPGWVMVVIDFSGIEVWMMALVSGDQVLLLQLQQGADVHGENTRLMLRIDKDHPDWDKARRAMKIWRFGGNYGGGLRTLYGQVRIEVPELELPWERFKEADDRYNEAHPQQAAWEKNLRESIVETRTLTTVFGFRRVFLGTDYEIQKEALATAIQSPAAEVANNTIIEADRLSPSHWEPMVPVHDAVGFMVPEAEVEACKQVLTQAASRRYTINGVTMSFPFKTSVGHNWAEVS